MLLASNKQQHEETTKKQKDTTEKTKHKEKDSWEEQNQVGLQQAAHLQDYIQNHLENFKCWIPKRNFSLLSNPLLLFNRIFRG